MGSLIYPEVRGKIIQIMTGRDVEVDGLADHVLYALTDQGEVYMWRFEHAQWIELHEWSSSHDDDKEKP